VNKEQINFPEMLATMQFRKFRLSTFYPKTRRLKHTKHNFTPRLGMKFGLSLQRKNT
jgi:hypothetical protein